MVIQNAFGSSTCANDLASILNEIEDESLSRKVAAHLHKKFHFIKQLAESNLDYAIKKHIARLYRNEVKDYLYNTIKVTNKHGFPDRVRDRIFNLITTKIRERIFDSDQKPTNLHRKHIEENQKIYDNYGLTGPIVLTKQILDEINERQKNIEQTKEK